MEKSNLNSTFLFIAFVGEQTILARKEKYSLVALDDGGTCLIPNVFIKTSRGGDEYISLPKTFHTEYRYTEYNRETKERKLITSKEISAWDIKKLLKATNDKVKATKVNFNY